MKLAITAFLLLILSSQNFAQHKVNWKRVSVLVYTKNGKGYVHGNIPQAVACVQKLGAQYGFKVDTSSDASVMTKEKLQQYTLLLFASTNNDVFDTDAQRLAFRQYIEAGGGFVGIHSVVGTERNWKWFKMMLGGSFAWHPKFQELKVKALHPNHESLKDVPKVWVRNDECYFARELYPGRTVLMAYDLNSLKAVDTTEQRLVAQHKGTYADLYPAVWAYQFDGGHTWCTALGHDGKDYSDPVFVNHILQGIRFIAASRGKLDYSKAYATSHDDPLQYQLETK
jgi:type 1 glutamine amidotransferase